MNTTTEADWWREYALPVLSAELAASNLGDPAQRIGGSMQIWPQAHRTVQ